MMTKHLSTLAVALLLASVALAQQPATLTGTITFRSGETLSGVIKAADLGIMDGTGVGTGPNGSPAAAPGLPAGTPSLQSLVNERLVASAIAVAPFARAGEETSWGCGWNNPSLCTMAIPPETVGSKCVKSCKSA